MITVKTIREKVAQYPDDGQAELLLEELIILYKIEKGIQEADEGRGITIDELENDMKAWWQSK